MNPQIGIFNSSIHASRATCAVYTRVYLGARSKTKTAVCIGRALPSIVLAHRRVYGAVAPVRDEACATTVRGIASLTPLSSSLLVTLNERARPARTTRRGGAGSPGLFSLPRESASGVRLVPSEANVFVTMLIFSLSSLFSYSYFFSFFSFSRVDTRSHGTAPVGVGHRGQRRRITMRHHSTDAHRLREHGALVQRHRWDTSLQVTLSRPFPFPFCFARCEQRACSKWLYPNPVVFVATRRTEFTGMHFAFHRRRKEGGQRAETNGGSRFSASLLHRINASLSDLFCLVLVNRSGFQSRADERRFSSVRFLTMTVWLCLQMTNGIGKKEAVFR